MVLSKTVALLAIITLIGAGLRLFQLTAFPPSLNWDEVSHAYNSFTLLHTGRDQWGQVLPVFNFRAYGDYPTTLNLYLTVPFIALMGPTDLAARLPQAVMGIVSIGAAFLAGYYWRKQVSVGLITAFLVAVEPWTLFTSRQILQSNGVILLLFLGLAWWLKTKSPLILGLSLLAYHNTRLFIPLLAAGLGFLSLKKGFAWRGWLIIVIFGGLILLSPTARSRSPWVGLINSGSIAYLEEARNLSSWPSGVTKALYNRPVYFVQKALTNYGEYFLPGFLFKHGGTQYQYSLPEWGVMHWVNLPFFYIGLIPGVIAAPWLGWWLLTAPLPAAITVDRFAVVRATTMLPAVYLITATGLVWLLEKLKSRWRIALLVAYGIVHGVATIAYLQTYTSSYATTYSASWQYGYAQVVDYTKAHYAEYDQIIFTKRYGEPHEYVLWYWAWPAQDIQNQISWDFHDDWYWVNSLDKFVFVNDWEMIEHVANLPSGSNYLIIASPENIPDGPQISQVNFLDDTTAFIIKEKL